jgi:hypothetical protein
VRYILVICLAALLAGCNKLTAQNYAKIEAGMSLEQITAIIGQPTRCDDVAGFQSCQWGDAADAAAAGSGEKGPAVSVQFVGDRAVMRSGTNLR